MDAAKFLTVLTELHFSAQPPQGSAAQFLNSADLVRRWKDAVPVGTLANWRHQGRGPAFVKVGSKVAYPVEKLKDWELQQLMN